MLFANTRTKFANMKPLILIACILADGRHYQPHGHYRDFAQCDRQASRFENTTFPSHGRIHPLCWCYRTPERHESPDDRKAP